MSNTFAANAGVAVNPPALQSFGPGGQIYNADLFGGFPLKTNKRENALFQFRKGDGAVEFSDLITNLEEAGKIGSTMAFMVTHVGFRIIPTSADTLLEPADIAALKFLMDAAQVEIFYGSNGTKVGEFSGMHMMAPVDFVAGDATNTCAVANAGNTGSNFIKLSEPIQIEPNLQIKGVVKFGADIPASLLPSGSDPAKFAFVVHLYGIKQVAA